MTDVATVLGPVLRECISLLTADTSSSGKDAARAAPAWKAATLVALRLAGRRVTVAEVMDEVLCAYTLDGLEPPTEERTGSRRDILLSYGLSQTICR